jgi:hypothetical protein
MAQLVITAALVEGRNKSEVARDYGVSPRWVVTLVQRYMAEGEAGLRPRSRRPLHSRRPSAFQAELWPTPMCFSWPPWVRCVELDGPEHPVRAFGPILAPRVSGRLGLGVSGPSGRILSPSLLAFGESSCVGYQTKHQVRVVGSVNH